MEKIIAIVEGNIPANRLLWIYGDKEGRMKIGLPKERGNYIDFVTNVELKDGETVTVSIKENPIWTVEAATKVEIGGNISVDTDGRVGSYTSSPVRIGYALNSGEEGDLIRFVRSPKVLVSKLPLLQNRTEK